MKKFKPYVIKSNNQDWLEEINEDYSKHLGYYTVLVPGVLTVYSTRPQKPTKKKEKQEDDDDT